jgi:hypothetical protein
MLDYGRLAWSKTMKDCARLPRQRVKLLQKFNRTWMARKIFGHWRDDRVLWRQRPPSKGLVIHRAPPD